MSGKKTEQRDIASIGLKTIISEVLGSQATTLVHCTAPLLVEGLNKPVRQIQSSACSHDDSLSWKPSSKC